MAGKNNRCVTLSDKSPQERLKTAFNFAAKTFPELTAGATPVGMGNFGIVISHDDDTLTKIADMMAKANEEVDIAEDGHTDVISAKNQVKIAMKALNTMNQELNKLNDEDDLPSWWTNKVAVGEPFVFETTRVQVLPLSSNSYHS